MIAKGGPTVHPAASQASSLARRAAFPALRVGWWFIGITFALVIAVDVLAVFAALAPPEPEEPHWYPCVLEPYSDDDLLDNLDATEPSSRTDRRIRAQYEADVSNLSLLPSLSCQHATNAAGCLDAELRQFVAEVVDHSRPLAFRESLVLRASTAHGAPFDEVVR